MIWPYASGRRPARPAALIDQWLPAGAFMLEHHDINVASPAEQAFAAGTTLPLSDLPFVRLLFSLRGIPFRSQMSVLDFFSTEPFLLLAREPPREIVFGIVGPFWSLHHGHMTPGIASAVLFAAYWLAIGPWSALIRQTLLDAAARRAKHQNTETKSPIP